MFFAIVLHPRRRGLALPKPCRSGQGIYHGFLYSLSRAKTGEEDITGCVSDLRGRRLPGGNEFFIRD